MEHLTTPSSSNALYSKISILYRTSFEPVFFVVAMVGNIAVLFGMARVKNNFNRSVRFYYLVVSIGGVIVVTGYYFVGDFLETVIANLVSGGAVYPILTFSASVWSCKLIICCGMGPSF